MPIKGLQVSKKIFIYFMTLFPPTVILRHRKENLKKCSLRGLENRPDFRFLTYPTDSLPDLSGYILLALDAPPLQQEDRDKGIFLIDATWKYAALMYRQIPQPHLFEVRSLISPWETAYPRKQTECPDPRRGLASIEALFLAYEILGRDTAGLLDHYHWKDSFLEQRRGEGICKV
jgi:pre-rRNA-processing protein TSR3